jgi:hypothetical protein
MVKLPFTDLRPQVPDGWPAHRPLMTNRNPTRRAWRSLNRANVRSSSGTSPCPGRQVPYIRLYLSIFSSNSEAALGPALRRVVIGNGKDGGFFWRSVLNRSGFLIFLHFFLSFHRPVANNSHALYSRQNGRDQYIESPAPDSSWAYCLLSP